jgi:hypothetical protein
MFSEEQELLFELLSLAERPGGVGLESVVSESNVILSLFMTHEGIQHVPVGIDFRNTLSALTQVLGTKIQVSNEQPSKN